MKKQVPLIKTLKRIIYFTPICALPFCSSPQASPLEAMAQPIIVNVKNDSVMEVVDKSGKKYVLSSADKFNYDCKFLHVGDTIAIAKAE